MTLDTIRSPTQQEWDAAVERLDGDLLQSWSWGDFKQRHGWTPERVMLDGDAGTAIAQVLFRRRGLFSIAYLPRGPLLSGDDALARQLLDEVDAACLRRRAVVLVVDPEHPLPASWHAHGKGFQRGVSAIQTPRTVKVALADDDQLLSQMRKDTRNNIRHALRRDVKIERAPITATSKERFYDLMLDTAARNGFGIHARGYYDDFVDILGDRAVLLFATTGGVTTAGLVAARTGRHARSMYSGSATAARGRGDAALLRFAAMQWAREQGCITYDLGGIAASAEEPAALHGVDVFKTGFGGTVVAYPETVERRYRPLLAWTFRRFSDRYRAAQALLLLVEPMPAPIHP